MIQGRRPGRQDVPPFITVTNENQFAGINRIGMSRRGFTPEADRYHPQRGAHPFPERPEFHERLRRGGAQSLAVTRTRPSGEVHPRIETRREQTVRREIAGASGRGAGRAIGEADSDGLSDPPRRFVDSELLLRRPECREKGGRFFFVRCVGGFRVSGAGLFPRRSGRVGGMRFDGFALRCETCTAGFRRYRLASQRPASVGGGVSSGIAPCRDGGCGGPETAFDAVRWSRNVRSRGSGSLPARGGR